MERRNHPRYPTKLPIILLLGDINGLANIFPGKIRNISFGGLFVTAEINQAQVQQIIEAKQKGKTSIDFVLDLVGHIVMLRGRIVWFDIAFNSIIRFRAGIELAEDNVYWHQYTDCLAPTDRVACR